MGALLRHHHLDMHVSLLFFPLLVDSSVLDLSLFPPPPPLLSLLGLPSFSPGALSTPFSPSPLLFLSLSLLCSFPGCLSLDPANTHFIASTTQTQTQRQTERERGGGRGGKGRERKADSDETTLLREPASRMARGHRHTSLRVGYMGPRAGGLPGAMLHAMPRRVVHSGLLSMRTGRAGL